MASISLKELKYDNQLVLVEAARKALAAKTDADGNVITTTYATKAEIGQLKNLEPIFVQELPATGDSKYLYFVPKAGSTGDAYNEYIWVSTSSSFELIGNSQIDISGKVDKLTTSGTYVYSHNGSTQGEIAVDTTTGGTAGSSSLITSGAVQAGLAGKQAASDVLTSVAGVSTASTGLIKMTNGVASIDTNSYALASDLAGKQNASTILTSIAGVATNTTGLIKLTNGVASIDTNSYALASDIKVSATDVTIDW